MSTKAEEESFDSGSRGNENESATERINNSLQKIRSELTEIRDQDLKLLKQLIQISETIKRLSEDRLSKRRTWYGQRQSLCSESAELYLDIEPLTPDLDDYRDAILVRQFSEPVSFSRGDLRDMRTTLSIFDAPISLEDSMDQSWPPNLSRVPLRHRPHSVSILTSSRSYGMESSQEWMETSDKSYEDILQRNVRLWKGRQSVHISDDEEDGTRTPVNDWSTFPTNGHASPVCLTEVDNPSNKRNRDSGSSTSSVFNSSGSSYGSSAINGDSSRSSCSSCSSCIFSGHNAGFGDTMVPEFGDNNLSDVENIVPGNSSVNLAALAEAAENNLTINGSAVMDGHCSDDFRDSKKNGNVCDDGDQTPVIEISKPLNELVKGDSERNGEEKSDKGADQGGEIGTSVPDVENISMLRDVKRVCGDIAEDEREGAAQITGGADGVACASVAGGEIGRELEVETMEERDLERRREREEIICMKGGTSREEEKAVGSRDKEKEKGKDKGKDGDKAKVKESGGGGVVRALLDHIGRKIESRVTVGMAEYSRSFLPVISEMSKRDGRQKADPHRPRELDIT